MSTGRRPYEVIKDAEVAFEAASALDSLAARIQERADAVRASAVADLEAVNLASIVDSISAAEPAGDPQARQMILEILADALGAVALSGLVPAQADDETVSSEQDVAEKRVEVMGVMVPVAERDTTVEVVIARAREDAGQGQAGPNPYITHRGRHRWKIDLYKTVFDQTVAEAADAVPLLLPSVRTAPAAPEPTLPPEPEPEPEPKDVPVLPFVRPGVEHHDVHEVPSAATRPDPVHRQTVRTPSVAGREDAPVQRELGLAAEEGGRRLPLPPSEQTPSQPSAITRAMRSQSPPTGRRPNLGMTAAPFKNSGAVLQKMREENGGS